MSNEKKGHGPQSCFYGSSEVAERWQQDVERRRQDMTEATQRMLETAGLKPGDHVLDIAAGSGDQSILAARIVGPDGSILATDISVEMLNVAVRAIQQEGLTTISTRVMDAEKLELEDNTFDAVICRLGLMLFPHPKLALSEIRRVLKPGGKFAALIWSIPENNQLFALPLAIVEKYAHETSPQRADPFALSEPKVLAKELTEAGFNEIITSALPFQSHYPSLDAYLNSTASRLTAGVMKQLSQPEQQHLLEEVREAVRQFEGEHGFVAPAELLLGAGRK
ncbi:methyltransferase domain-containing protein [Ktedonosporobacter rubrisoli]|uniref:Methyltransferase domain-containing protein n=1 Tax=Ktedonosporobacter rubrisoli TaxID=2509675 RepID=A0A4P6JU20_KTERU|nr:class I SAM-dependent methyltransferase [Ktedonosporobacter rubrisoli]QBD79108.1 methyltransferase domain-containing protein [Ktedonosporobacter rubrisoli]